MQGKCYFCVTKVDYNALSVIQLTGFCFLEICFKITNGFVFRFKLHLMVNDDTRESKIHAS